MTQLLLGIALVGLFFILMSVRLIFLKDGKFKGTCASQSPFLKKEGGTCGYCGKNMEAGEACGKEEGGTCGYCGKNMEAGEACGKEEEENEVEKVLSKF